MEPAAVPETGPGEKDTRGHVGRIMADAPAQVRSRRPASRFRLPFSERWIARKGAGQEVRCRDRWFAHTRAGQALPADGTDAARDSGQSPANREIRPCNCAP